ncbi:MAG: hypothetical protein RJQ09_05505 [Cyclobacteriaceae bacterium]
MKTLEVKKEVKEMFDQGMHPSAIKDQLEDISLSTVYRWCNEFKTLNGDDGHEDIDESLSGIERDQFNEAIEDDLDEDYEDEGLGQLIDDDFDEDEGVPVSVRDQKSILKGFKKIFREILENSNGATWTRKDLRKTLEAIEDLKDDIEKSFDDVPSRYRSNALHTYLLIYEDILNDGFNMGDDFAVIFQFTEFRKNEIQKILEVTDFNEVLDLDDYNRSKAKMYVSELISDYLEFSDDPMDSDDIDKLRGEALDTRAFITEYGFQKEMNDEVFILTGILKDLTRMSKKIENSLFGSKTLQLEPEWQKVLEECQTQNS